MENENMEKLRKELRITRVLTILNSVVVAGLLIVLIVAMSAARQVFTYVESMKPTLDSFAEMDMGSFQAMMDELDVESLNRIANEIDVDGLNEVISEINEIDVEELEKATENINKAVEGFEEFEKKFSSLFGGR